MSVQAVNSVNNIQQKPVQSPIEPKKSEQKESIANGTTLLLGSLAALAIGTGIYFATKGRGTSGTSSATGSSSTVNQIKEYTAKAFTDAGNKFEKGVAKLKNGENYTGTITHTTKDGKFVVREYENGLIKKSTMYECENAEKLDTAIWRKEYTFSDDRKFKKVFCDYEDKIIFFDKIIKNNEPINRIRTTPKFNKNDFEINFGDGYVIKGKKNENCIYFIKNGEICHKHTLPNITLFPKEYEQAMSKYVQDSDGNLIENRCNEIVEVLPVTIEHYIHIE